MFINAKKTGTLSMAALALMVASCGAHAAGNVADAAMAQVNITATVVGGTCTPSWKSSTPVAVDLGKVSDTNMADKGDIGSMKPFTLSLTDCASGISKVSVMSVGTPDSVDSSAYANLDAGTTAAKGVAVTLFGGTDQKTQLKPSGSTADYAINNGGADMVFLAKLERTSDSSTAITDGSLQSTATLYMTYE